MVTDQWIPSVDSLGQVLRTVLNSWYLYEYDMNIYDMSIWYDSI